MKRILMALCLFITLDALPLVAQNAPYLWPTTASESLTSAFGEYRSRRFHMGVDIKTWGKTGYEVFAIRSGYVWRVSVAPTGYGKVLYLKLDTGEVAVFAHLSGFASAIEELVRAEQERLGKYRVNIYLKQDQMPVVQGEVVAYTGQTGIGAPHLHFEIRDAQNRPQNPLSKQYALPDNVSPIISKISFTPLDGDSEVNADFKPLVLPVEWRTPGDYHIDRQVQIWGNIGVAVACYDKGPNASNRYGVYSLKLYVDDILRFQYSFDKLTFQDNPLVELERDYRLSSRGYGRFQKLYKAPFNERKGYVPNHDWAGVLRSTSLDEETDLQTIAGGDFATSHFETGTLFPGRHDIRVEVADYFGNSSSVTGRILVGSAFLMRPVLTEDSGQLVFEDILTYDLRRIERLEAHYLNNANWLPVPVQDLNSQASMQEKGGDGPGLLENASSLFFINRPRMNTVIMKFTGYDQFDAASYPYYFVDGGRTQNSVQPQIDFDYDFYDDYVRIAVESNHILAGLPTLAAYTAGRDSVAVPLFQVSLKRYVGRLALAALDGSVHALNLTARNLAGDEFSARDLFYAQPVIPQRTGRLTSEDGACRVNFWSGSLYQPYYGRVERQDMLRSQRYQFASARYSVEPKDVLMRNGAFVQIRHPDDEETPEKLGIYQKAGSGNWRFLDNRLDESAGMIAAKIMTFGEFTLIRDLTAPEITGMLPEHGARLTDRTPRLVVTLFDRLSGIASETAIDMVLDGRRLIAEYDPERNRLSYQVREPLLPGTHKLTVTATDRCSNVARREATFVVE